MVSAVRQGFGGVNAHPARVAGPDHHGSPLNALDLAVARRASMGQEPLVVSTDGVIASVRITRPYGRLGNNVYQVLNAALVARAAGFEQLLLPPGMAAVSLPAAVHLEGLSVAPYSGEPPAGCLAGSFYVPFGCERPVLRWPVAPSTGWRASFATPSSGP